MQSYSQACQRLPFRLSWDWAKRREIWYVCASDGARILSAEILERELTNYSMRGESRRSNHELKLDWKAYEKTIYRVATPKDIKRLLSTIGPEGKFPPEPGLRPDFYHPSPELVGIEARQFLARVRKDLEDLLLFTKPVITVNEKSED